MLLARHIARLLLACAVPAFGQGAQPLAPNTSSRALTLNVVVDGTSREPLEGLPQAAFAVLDNGKPQPLTSFRALSGRTDPEKMLLVVDAINIDFTRLSYERDQIGAFLRSNDGQLRQPTSLAILTDTSSLAIPGYSTDGNALDAQLEKQSIGLRDLRRNSGFYGAEERLDLSLRALRMLLAQQATIPGHKAIVWVSPGWPLLSGPSVDLSSREESALFAEVVALSTQIRQADVTLYSVDPLGSEQNPGSRFFYESFLKGVRKPGGVLPGNLGLQVLAIQSGGLALNGSNDVRGLLERCAADAGASYAVSYVPPPADGPNTYHAIEVTVAGPHLTARTSKGFYSQPQGVSSEAETPTGAGPNPH